MTGQRKENQTSASEAETFVSAPAVLNGVNDARNGDGSPRAELAACRERMRILQRIMAMQLQDEKLRNELVKIILEG